MAHRKAGGSAKNLKDSNPKYLGIKLSDGQKAKKGQVIVRQRGTKFIAGQGVDTGKDHTLFAIADGTVSYKNKRKISFNGSKVVRKLVEVR